MKHRQTDIPTITDNTIFPEIDGTKNSLLTSTPKTKMGSFHFLLEFILALLALASCASVASAHNADKYVSLNSIFSHLQFNI